MEERELKQLFDSMKIPEPDSEKRKETLNLATAEFEAEAKKNAKIAQGFLSRFRLTGQEQPNRRAKMTFSTRKLVYGGLATACVALMIFTVPGLHTPQTKQDALIETTSVDSATLNKDSQTLIAEAFTAGPEGLPAPVDELAKSKPVEAKKEVMADARGRAEEGEADMSVASSIAPVAPMPTGNIAARMAAPELLAAPPGVMGGGMAAYDQIQTQQQYFGNDKFTDFDESPIKQVKAEPVSTFSIDVDTAAYSFVRQSLDNGVLPQKDAVRVEEMVNYFDYDYAAPTSKDEPFKSSVTVTPSPWNKDRKLVHIGIRGYDIDTTEKPKSNLVFLLDVSGSMNEPKKLPLVKQSISMLLDTLGKDDKVSIVVYAGAAGTVLEPTSASEKGKIMQALQNLQAGGGTAGAEGIRTAYQLAEANFDKNAVNRVILATDGDFNVGITNPEELQDFVERKRESGVFLSVIGFGTGNYNDAMMQTLAQNGNGTAAYIDSINEARKVLVEEASSTLFPIAKDVKIQVEFNPSQVAEYRLVGYETRALKTEDFNNDKVDAGDIGAGHTVTAIYEITPADSKAKLIDENRYADNKAAAPEKTASSDELAFVKIRYKLPDQSESKLITRPVTSADEKSELTGEAGWAVSVASFAQLLKGGQYTGSMTYDDVLKLAEANRGQDKFGYRAEFLTLIHKAKTASSLQQQP